MSVAAEIRRANQTPGRCIACDEPLPVPPKHRGGRRRSALCGDADCLRVYHQLRRSVVKDLLAMALNMRGAANAIRRANKRLQKGREQ